MNGTSYPGLPTDNSGVYGYSASGPGVQGKSANTHGVQGTGGSGSGDYGGYFTGWGGVYGQGPVVTTWDSAAGKAGRLVLPRYVDANSEALWKPLYEQLRQRLAKRGLDKSMMLGMITDVWPGKGDAGFLAKVAPGVGWVALWSSSIASGYILASVAARWLHPRIGSS